MFKTPVLKNVFHLRISFLVFRKPASTPAFLLQDPNRKEIKNHSNAQEKENIGEIKDPVNEVGIPGHKGEFQKNVGNEFYRDQSSEAVDHHNKHHNSKATDGGDQLVFSQGGDKHADSDQRGSSSRAPKMFPTTTDHSGVS